MPGERTEQATPHRREKARKEGDILHSREFSAAAGTLAGVMALGMMGMKALLEWRQTFASFLELGNPERWEPTQMGPTLIAMRRLMLGAFAGPALVMVAVAAAVLGAGLLQTGGVSLHMQAIGFKPDRINPLTNIKNLFSLRAAARLGKSLIPAALLSPCRFCETTYRRQRVLGNSRAPHSKSGTLSRSTVAGAADAAAGCDCGE